MLNLSPTVIMVLSSISLIGTYFAVRMDIVRPILGFIIGSTVTSMFFLLFAISRGNTLIHALVVGSLLGFVFSGFAVAMGLFYRHGVAVNTTEMRSVAANMPEINSPEV